MRPPVLRAAALLLLPAGLALLLAWPGREAAVPDLATAPEATRGAPALLHGAGPAAARDPAPALRTRPPPAAGSAAAVRGPVTVRVVGPGGDALPGVFVGVVARTAALGRNGWAPRPPPDAARATDEGGEVVFADLPYDGSLAALAYDGDPASTETERLLLLASGAGHPRSTPVVGEHVVLYVGVGRWFELEVVDAETGRRLPRGRARPSTPVPRAAEAFDRVGSSEFFVRRASPRFLVLTAGEAPGAFALEVEPPPRMLAWDARSWVVAISPYASLLRARYPVRSEVDVSVAVLDADGTPSPLPSLRRASVGGRDLLQDGFTTDGYGRLRLGGVPFLPGEVLAVTAGSVGRNAVGTAQAPIGETPQEGLHLVVRLPPEEPSSIGLGGGGAGGSFRGRGRGSRTLTAGGGARLPRGAVTVAVLRRDGTAARGACVTLGTRTERTDLAGRAHFPQVPPGRYPVTVRQVGLLPLGGEVVVEGEERARLELREGKAGRIDLEVVDESGRALSFATLTVKTSSGEPWVDLQGDVQRLDPFTDHEGRRTLGGLEPGPVVVGAGWGSRSRSVTVPVEPEGVHAVRIVLPRPQR